MSAKPEAMSSKSCRVGSRFFCKGSWRRLKRDAKRAVRRRRRRMERQDPDCGSRFTRGWAD